MPKHISEIIEIINEVCEDGAEISCLSLDDKISNMWSSLTQLALINELENRYNVKFSMQQIISLKTVRDIVELINESDKD